MNSRTDRDIVDYPVLDPNAPLKPRRQFYVDALIAGKTLAIRKVAEHPVFYRLFTRACGYRKIRMKLSLRQIDQGLWHLIPWKSETTKPETLLPCAFRKHGRYRFFVTELVKGKKLMVESLDEVEKIRLGVNRYVPLAERRSLELKTVTSGGKRAHVVVQLVPKKSKRSSRPRS